MIKILFTSVGRRVELMQAFRAAADRLGASLEIWGADITDTAPALLFCDRAVMVPRIREESYIPTLLQICEREKIDALIPTIDTDLLLLSENKSRFTALGTRVLVGAPEKIRLCRDKRLTADYFHSLGLESPAPVSDYRDYRGGYPAFIKPRDGSSSIGAHKVSSPEELSAYAAEVPDYIVQPFVSGVEYTVDAFCDLDGEPVFITPRIRQAVRAGEVLKSKIVNDEKIILEVKALLSDYKPEGAITVQLIKDEGGINNYIEINPRFGGGAPISIAAGADSAEATVRLLLGERLRYQHAAAAEGAVFSRYDSSASIASGEAEVRAVIFDLDDTLYPERDYVKSGFRAVAALLSAVSDCEKKLWAAFEAQLPAIDTVLFDEGIYTEELKAECLRAYRGHMPEIKLYDGVLEMLADLRAKGIKLGIITDGRPEGQKNKIEALGIAELFDEIIITDELGGRAFNKPCDIAFRIMQRRLCLPFEKMLYVGDNAAKDLIAPRRLSMQAVWLSNPDGIYTTPSGALLPEKRISAVTEVAKFVK